MYHNLSEKSLNVGLFQLLREANESIFINDKIREEVLNLFCKIQKTVKAFSKLAFLYKYKKAPFQIETDLYLTPISEKDKNVITIFQNGNKYLFSLVDIIKIIKNSICQTDHFFSTPVSCKNPYNKISFNKSNLYNIYFFIKQSGCIMPEIIQNYFLTEFHLKKFQEENNYLIREYSIKEYIHDLSEEDILNYIEQMISFYNRFVKTKNNRIFITNEFPKDKLIHIFKPYLQIYFCYRYSNNTERITEKKTELLCKLFSFSQYNPQFGKVYIKNIPVFYKKMKNEKIYNDKHIPFHENNNQDLSNSHIEMIETILNYEEIRNNIDFNATTIRSTSRHIRYDVDDSIENPHNIFYEDDDDQENENDSIPGLEEDTNDLADLIHFNEHISNNGWTQLHISFPCCLYWGNFQLKNLPK